MVILYWHIIDWNCSFIFLYYVVAICGSNLVFRISLWSNACWIVHRRGVFIYISRVLVCLVPSFSKEEKFTTSMTSQWRPPAISYDATIRPIVTKFIRWFLPDWRDIGLVKLRKRLCIGYATIHIGYRPLFFCYGNSFILIIAIWPSVACGIAVLGPLLLTNMV